MVTFPLVLYDTYYRKPHFNVPVDYDRFVGPSGRGPMSTHPDERAVGGRDHEAPVP